MLGSKRLASRYDFDDLMLDRAMSPEARLANGLASAVSGRRSRSPALRRAQRVTVRERVFDAQEILRVLAAHSVDFVVIGGIAVQAHGYIRWTKDLDIIVRPTALNLSRLSEALRELEAELRGPGTLKLTDPQQLRAGAARPAR